MQRDSTKKKRSRGLERAASPRRHLQKDQVDVHDESEANAFTLVDCDK